MEEIEDNLEPSHLTPSLKHVTAKSPSKSICVRSRKESFKEKCRRDVKQLTKDQKEQRGNNSRSSRVSPEREKEEKEDQMTIMMRGMRQAFSDMRNMQTQLENNNKKMEKPKYSSEEEEVEVVSLHWLGIRMDMRKIRAHVWCDD